MLAASLTYMDTLHPETARILQTFADANGTSTRHLLLLAAHALAEHLATTGSLTLPLTFRPPQCTTCPHVLSRPETDRHNVVTFMRG